MKKRRLGVRYDPAVTEEKWLRHWQSAGLYHSNIDTQCPAFTLVLPPPNITGVLHLGHVLNVSVQDVLCRRAKSQGYNVCWVPGTDHASIATEAKVWESLAEQNKNKTNTSQEEFLQAAYAWKEEFGGRISAQLKRMGLALDWKRNTFTLDDHYSDAVAATFVRLYEKGWIFKGERMIHWDPVAKTVISEEEVLYETVNATLYYIRYRVCGTDESVVIATRRPETIMADVALCAHPADTRYRHLHGKTIRIPLIDKEIPFITDEYVDPHFGTGLLKITPAHDPNDYAIGKKYNLPIVNILNEDATINEHSPILQGLDRFVARKKILDMLRAAAHLDREEVIQAPLALSQRTNAIVETRLSTQWFVKMGQMCAWAIEQTKAGKIKMYPEERFVNTYFRWLEQERDWCISRQLWWGHRIPAYSDGSADFVVALNREAAVEKFLSQHGKTVTPAQLVQEEDCLDTWFSSWLWPMEVFRGVTAPQNPAFSYYYPIKVLVTGQDILFFWVARMVMAACEYGCAPPFEKIYFTGMVRDSKGRKMSKSLGNSPDILALIDRYGTDALRFGVLIAAPVGNDLLFDEKTLEQGRNFNNKLWNTLRLLQLWQENASIAQADGSPPCAVQQFANSFIRCRAAFIWQECERLCGQFQLSEALKLLYSFTWEDFCSSYLEWVKPPENSAIHPDTLTTAREVFIFLLRVLHPFLPFVTEEIHAILCPDGGTLYGATPRIHTDGADNLSVDRAKRVQALIRGIREFQVANGLTKKDPLFVHIEGEDTDFLKHLAALFHRQTAAIYEDLSAHAQWQVIPVGKDVLRVHSPRKVVVHEHSRQKCQEEKERLVKFLASIDKKLSNERFLRAANPEVVDRERQKKADTLQKIAILEKTLET